jgi:DNA-binding response OmpR family regulator
MKSVTTILFIENDAVALTMYQKRLQREGFHVETAEDGIAALKVLSEMTPDVVVLDLMLPKFSGRDVFDYMRADEQFKQVPVIIFSNAAKSEWPKDAEATPTRALPKSEANFSALLELIREMTAASAAAAAQRNNVPEPEPSLVLPAGNSTATAGSMTEVPEEVLATQTAAQFLEYAVADMPVVREHCLAYIKTPVTDAGRRNLSELRRRLQLLHAGAEKSGCARLSLLAGAWECLLAEIEHKPAIASPSILQTLAQAADCLRILLNHDGIASLEPLPKARVLSVDDDEICNDVAVTALQRANIDADSVLYANDALELLQQNNYDLVLLDINMPGMTGFELCEKLRALPQHEKTPVIFVTAFNNFENRKQSVLSGGGDLIAKPVSPLELALKVTIHLLKAPPKPASAPPADTQATPGLVWREPEVTISHDTEMFLKGVKDFNGTPNLAAPTTQTLTTDPENDPMNASAAETPTIPEEVFQPAALVPSGPLAGLHMKAVDETPVESALNASAPAPEAERNESTIPEETLPPAGLIPAGPVAELGMQTVESETFERVAQSHPLADEGMVAPPQTPARSEPALPISNGSSQQKKPIMSKENNPQFDTLVLDVTNIIFGENAPEINARLVRMALEQVWQNRAALQSLDAIAREIARIIFGDANISDLNVRLVRMALERSNSIALFKAA